MKINVAKTKILLLTPPIKPTMELLIKIEMNKLQQVTGFKYFSSYRREDELELPV
jgi:hypothetical protein